MDTRTITRKLDNEELCAILEYYYRGMSTIDKDEEIVDTSLTNGFVTFTIKRIDT